MTSRQRHFCIKVRGVSLISLLSVETRAKGQRIVTTMHDLTTARVAVL